MPASTSVNKLNTNKGKTKQLVELFINVKGKTIKKKMKNLIKLTQDQRECLNPN